MPSVERLRVQAAALMDLDRSWSGLAARLKVVAEDSRKWDPAAMQEDRILESLGLVSSGDLTDVGNKLYMAQFVKGDSRATSEALGEALKENEVVNTFCGRLWAEGDVLVGGAVSLLKRITGSVDDAAAKRWIVMMNAGGIIAYDRKRSKLRVLYNPSELLPPDVEAEREKVKGHVISPDTPFTNLMFLKELLRSARGDVRWYEPHLPAKALEVLAREMSGEGVTRIRLLSGPANVTGDLKDEYKRFRKEMKAKRRVDTEWRILSRKDAADHHDRVFFAEDLARNIPPLNTILKGSTGEILESGIDPDEFEKWWALGQDLADFTPEDAPPK